MHELRRAARVLGLLTLTRMRDFVREPEAVFWVLVFPSLLAGVLGVAFQNGPSQVQLVAATTPALIASLSQEPLLSPQLLPTALAEAALGRGAVTLVVEDAADGGVVYVYDDTNDAARNARILADRAVQRGAGQQDPIAARDITRSAPGSRYIDFLSPGLLGMTLMSSAIWGVGYPIADARRRNLMKLLIATPMPRILYLLSFVIHGLVLMSVEASVLVAFGAITFGVPLRGSLMALTLVCAGTSLTFSGAGLLLAARARTVEAASGLMNLAMLPMLIGSGVFFPSQQFPSWVKPVFRALPLTASVDALRAVMLKGAALSDCAGELAMLAAWGIACFSLAAWVFRWR